MATRTIVQTVDDLDGSLDACKRGFALDGVNYEIDLTDLNYKRMQKELAEFVRGARRDIGRTGLRTTRARQQSKPAQPKPEPAPDPVALPFSDAAPEPGPTLAPEPPAEPEPADEVEAWRWCDVEECRKTQAEPFKSPQAKGSHNRHNHPKSK